MKKVSLQDMKNKNRSFILRCILEKDNLSRIELAEQSGLSPSTISSLVSELLQEQVLMETGETASTGGRKRTGLTVNPGYAFIAIVDVKRDGAVLYLFDMQLQSIDAKVLSKTYIAGNDLLISITSAIFDLAYKHSLSAKKLVGIGLLFQEDMLESEFNVMYSTSLSSASISLKDALFTQFHTLVVQEYSQSYTMAQHAAELEEKKSVAFINIGQRVLASITVDGRQVDIHGNRLLDITPLVEFEKTKWPMLVDGEKANLKKQNFASGLLDGTETAKERTAAAVRLLTSAMKPLCVLFSLNDIVLSGKILKLPNFIKAIQESLIKQLEPLPAPNVRENLPMESRTEASNLLAGKIREKTLCTNELESLKGVQCYGI